MADSPPRRMPRLEAEAEAPDLLSSLPLDVLDKILSRIHIRAVVRTSALSRAWRRRWESLPTVDLSWSRVFSADEVDALLLRRSDPVRTFRLAAYDDSWYVDALHDWLLYLSRNGVENLLLWFPPVNFRLHSSLFSCRELTSLNLTSCRIPPALPGFAGFPSLKTLHLDKVVISEHGGRELAALISESPLIEKVQLLRVELIGDDPEAEDEWVIRGPNLRELTIASGFPYGGRVEDLPLLQEGLLVGCNYAKFLMGMARVTKLEFACGSNNWASEVDVLDGLPFLFENLRSLVVSVDFTKMAQILSFFCLLRSAPFLEELNVWGWSDGTQEIDANDEFFNAQWVGTMFAKLHVVRMKKILCFGNEMHFIKFILLKARALRVLSVRLGPDALCSNEEALNAIKGYSRASPDAQVIVLGSRSSDIGSTKTCTENAEVEKTQTTSSRHDSIDTTTVNAEVETPTTSSEHVSVDTSAENAKVEEAQTEESECGSITISEVEETQTTGSERGSISMSTENAKATKTQTGMGHESINTSTENAEVEETRTRGSEMVYDVCPRRRQRLDLESAAQLEQLKEDMLELQKQLQLDIGHRRLELEGRTGALDALVKNLKMLSCLKNLSEKVNISLPPYPQPSSVLSSHLAMSRVGGTHVNPCVNGAASAHMDSPEDHGENDAANVHANP